MKLGLKMSRERTILERVADPTWIHETKHPLGFSVPPCDHVRIRSRAVEARRAGCETVSVTDSLRPPDRLARRTSSQNDLSVVHTEKKRRRLCPSMLKRGNSTSLVKEKKNRDTTSEIRFAFTRRVLSIHPVSFPARYIDCINTGILCIAFA